ncbi:DNA cytosine methyltransferase, partial [Halomonas sp. HMF6819]|uniref:DNA cytosine methyltransferase n=1 Tax=Halomonas sp. HMF6819 TaxID=3373085 RepID=UPI0037B0BDF4
GFVSCLKRHGYQVDWQTLRACDYGTPTIRRRLFLIARRDGLPIVWPKPTHADPRVPAVQRRKLKPWRTAAECIDWSLPCPSIFGRKKPLAEATLNRIRKGVQRYVLEHQQPFIVTCNHGGAGFRGQGMQEPMKTITAAHDAHGIVTPYLVKLNHTAANYTPFRGQSLEQPLQTITTAPGYAIVAPTLVQTGYGERDGQAPRCLDLQKPLGTVVAGGSKHALVAAFLAKHYTGVVGADLRQPLPTVTTTDHDAVVSAFMINMKGSQRSAIDARQPLNTICASTTHAYLTAAFLAPYAGGHQLPMVMIDGEQYIIVDIGMRMLQPHELAAAQGFPDTYRFAKIDGQPLAKSKQVRLIGNSVCPPLARAIVEANFTHERRFMPLGEAA